MVPMFWVLEDLAQWASTREAEWTWRVILERARQRTRALWDG